MDLRVDERRSRNPQQFHRVPFSRHTLWKTFSNLWKTREELVESLWNRWGKSPAMIRIAKSGKS
ncbi:hypothetical protein CKA32_005894 [Geitlerinema sp. FC II]|nr:hypothetical protein CKA32_005894 [Geitlerinema sp. FC II]